MAYKVIITPLARRSLDRYIEYTIKELRNKQGARAIMDDARLTKKKLSTVADSLRVCTHPLLKKHGYRKMRFQKHAFVMIYRIDKDCIIVERMYHELQDYESIFVNEMHLR